MWRFLRPVTSNARVRVLAAQSGDTWPVTGGSIMTQNDHSHSRLEFKLPLRLSRWGSMSGNSSSATAIRVTMLTRFCCVPDHVLFDPDSAPASRLSRRTAGRAEPRLGPGAARRAP